MTFKIVTDSCCNLPEDIIDDLDLTTFPLVFMIGEEQHQSYLKGEVTDLQQFYTHMREGKVFTTSLPNLKDAEADLKAIFESGNDVLYLGFSSALSGTYEAINLLGSALVKKYPDRTFIAIDTLAASLGQGLLVYYAAKMRAEGKTVDEVASWVRENLLHMCHWFTVGDLSQLRRGGRLSAGKAIVGNLLNIKPVLHVDDQGHLVPMESAKGRKKSIEALLKHMEESAIDPQNQRIYISHGDCLDEARALAAMIQERLHVVSVTIGDVGPVIGAHSGLGTLALFFLGTQR